MQDPNRAQLEAAVRVLQPLLDELVFAGGCASGRWPTRLLFPPGPLITDPASGSVRPTMDVDVITELASYVEYACSSDGDHNTRQTSQTFWTSLLCRDDDGAAGSTGAAPVGVRNARIEIQGVARVEHILLISQVHAERALNRVDELDSRMIVRP